MAISETKMQMVIANYFKDECDVNTSIRQAFEKGFRIGVKKGASTNRPQEWIPCSERLPSEQGQYLVTFPLCNGEPWVYILSFNKGKYYETDDEWGDVEYDDVTAWMPLPKPYSSEKPNNSKERSSE